MTQPAPITSAPAPGGPTSRRPTPTVQRLDDVQRAQSSGIERGIHAHVGQSQQQKRVGRVAEREDEQHAPAARRTAAAGDASPAARDRRPAPRGARRRPRGRDGSFTQEQRRDRQRARDDRQREQRAVAPGQASRNSDASTGPSDGAGVVHRAVEAEDPTASRRRGARRQHARRAARRARPSPPGPTNRTANSCGQDVTSAVSGRTADDRP